MRVVRVAARRDYEGIAWTELFSSVDRAVAFLRGADADTFSGINAINVAWVGVDSDSDDDYESILDFEVNSLYDEDAVNFDGHDREVFNYNA